MFIFVYLKWFSNFMFQESRTSIIPEMFSPKTIELLLKIMKNLIAFYLPLDNFLPTMCCFFINFVFSYSKLLIILYFNFSLRFITLSKPHIVYILLNFYKLLISFIGLSVLKLSCVHTTDKYQNWSQFFHLIFVKSNFTDQSVWFLIICLDLYLQFIQTKHC